MSAPCAIGWIRYGVAMVLSTISGTPLSWPPFRHPGDVEDVDLRVEMVSAKNALVLAAPRPARSPGRSGSTNVVLDAQP